MVLVRWWLCGLIGLVFRFVCSCVIGCWLICIVSLVCLGGGCISCCVGLMSGWCRLIRSVSWLVLRWFMWLIWWCLSNVWMKFVVLLCNLMCGLSVWVLCGWFVSCMWRFVLLIFSVWWLSVWLMWLMLRWLLCCLWRGCCGVCSWFGCWVLVCVLMRIWLSVMGNFCCLMMKWVMVCLCYEKRYCWSGVCWCGWMSWVMCV